MLLTAPRRKPRRTQDEELTLDPAIKAAEIGSPTSYRDQTSDDGRSVQSFPRNSGLGYIQNDCVEAHIGDEAKPQEMQRAPTNESSSAEASHRRSKSSFLLLFILLLSELNREARQANFLCAIAGRCQSSWNVTLSMLCRP